MCTDDRDARFMRAALALARRGQGQVWPNPAVGCLIVGGDDGSTMAGRGWTQAGGRPHAETVALEEAGAAARGATVYVTLEPCAHHGRTPPCAEALIAAGVARVVSGLDDPDPRVSGRGHEMLRATGIRVDTGCLAEEAALVIAGHTLRTREGRPHVTLKLAVSADGMIAARSGERTAITGPEAEAYVHMLRATSDAVMVGAGTWRADDPELTCRLPGLRARSPVRVALDARGELPLDSKLVASARDVPLWVIVGPEALATRREGLGVAGAGVIEAPITDEGRFDLSALLAILAGRGITRLLVEGGARLAESLLTGGLADKAVVLTAPDMLGPDAVPALPTLTLGHFEEPERFDLVASDRLGPDKRDIFRRRRAES